MSDTEILDALAESLARWRKKSAIRFDVQIGEVVFTSSPHDQRSLRECLVQAIERHITDQVARRLTNRNA